MQQLISTIQTGDTRQINDVASRKFGKPVNILKFLNDSMMTNVSKHDNELLLIIQRHIETTHQVVKKAVTRANAVALAEDLNITYGGDQV